LIIDDLPMPQAPETPIEIGRPRACTTISATVSDTPEKFRKSRSVSLSGHIALAPYVLVVEMVAPAAGGQLGRFTADGAKDPFGNTSKA
jgi:hypothetical protein